MSKLEITTQEMFEARQSFIAERIAIMIYDGGMSEEKAVEGANVRWEKYARRLKYERNTTAIKVA
jgi:hypothetical protein